MVRRALLMDKFYMTCATVLWCTYMYVYPGTAVHTRTHVVQVQLLSRHVLNCNSTYIVLVVYRYGTIPGCTCAHEASHTYYTSTTPDKHVFFLKKI